MHRLKTFVAAATSALLLASMGGGVLVTGPAYGDAECLPDLNASAGIAHSEGFTTCGSAQGVGADLTYGAGSFKLTPANASERLLSSISDTYYNPSSGVDGYVKLSYVRSNASSDTCILAAVKKYGATSATATCTVRNASPSDPTYVLQGGFAPPGNTAPQYKYIVNNVVRATTLPGFITGNLLIAGVERMDGPTTDTTPLITFGNLRYYKYDSDVFKPWGSSSACSKSGDPGVNNFSPQTFATSFAAAMGRGNSYACANSVAVSGSTSWNGR